MDVRTAFRWYRKEMGLIREAGDRELIQGIPAVTIALFVLGPFPQALKVFDMSGLPWTKTWAAIFLAAWLSEAMVRFAAGISSTRSLPTPLAATKSLTKPSKGRVPDGPSPCKLKYGFGCFYLYVYPRTSEKHSRHSLPLWLGRYEGTLVLMYGLHTNQ